jgi:site-specific recombinase XerD
MADYRRSVERAVKFFGSRRRLADVEPPDVRAYVRELEGEGMAPSSVRKRLAPLKAMFATAVEDGRFPVTRREVCERVAAARTER